MTARQEPPRASRRPAARRPRATDAALGGLEVTVATTVDHLREISALVHANYVAAGMLARDAHELALRPLQLSPNAVPIIALHHGRVIATNVVVPDGPDGLPLDDAFSEPFDRLRAQGPLAEIGRAAVAPAWRGTGAMALVYLADVLVARAWGIEFLVAGVRRRGLERYLELFGSSCQVAGNWRTYDLAGVELQLAPLAIRPSTAHERVAALAAGFADAVHLPPDLGAAQREQAVARLTELEREPATAPLAA